MKCCKGETVNCCGRRIESKRFWRWFCVLAIGLPLLVLLVLLSTLLIKAAVVEELYVRQELFPGQPAVFMDLSEAEWRSQAERLAEAISVQTVSYEAGDLNTTALDIINQRLNVSFSVGPA